MMRLIHTADLHLKKGEKNRLEVLRWLINNLERFGADALIIAGDLFDNDTDANILRPEVRKIFQNTDAKVIIIPGNHDQHSYSYDYDYGENVVQLIKTPFESYQLAGIKIVGIPYQEKRFIECIKDLPEEIDLLVAHGTLYDKTFIFNYIDDEETRYMPVYPESLSGLARYIALGHIHSRCIEKKYGDTFVVYPGSPSALDIKCVGKRCVYLVEFRDGDLKMETVEVEISPYWVTREFFLFPGAEAKLIDEIREFLSGIKDKRVMVHLDIRGFSEESDRNLKSRVEQLIREFKGKFSDFRIDTDKVQSWSQLLENRIVRNFVQKTEGIEFNLRMKIFEITLPIFNKLLE